MSFIFKKFNLENRIIVKVTFIDNDTMTNLRVLL